MEIKKPAPSKIPPPAGLLIGILAVSTASIFIRFAQAEIPSLLVAAGRMVIAAILLTPFVLTSKWSIIRGLAGRQWQLLILAGVFLGGHFAVWITSLEYTSVASSVVFVTTAPLWVALFSPIFLKEKLSRMILLGLLVSLAGSIIVALSSNCSLTRGGLACSGIEDLVSSEKTLGNLLALAGAFLSAGYLIIGRKARTSMDLPTYTYLVYSIAALVLIIAVVLSGEKIIGYSFQSYFWLFALALLPQLVGHSAFNWALKYLRAAFVSIALLGEPVGTILLAYLFLKEKPAILEIAGGILILIGITIATLRPGDQEKQSTLLIQD